MDKHLSDCDIVLILIGPSWVTCKGDDGSLRLFAEVDHVRIEVEAALAKWKQIIPLVINTSMPKAKELPNSIQGMVHLNALEIRPDPDFDRDIERLIKAIRTSSQGKSRSTKLNLAGHGSIGGCTVSIAVALSLAIFGSQHSFNLRFTFDAWCY